MMDIVKRLQLAPAQRLHVASMYQLGGEAADEITRLRAEVEKWKTAFGAQSRKLQVALEAGGEPVREAVRAALHHRRQDADG